MVVFRKWYMRQKIKSNVARASGGVLFCATIPREVLESLHSSLPRTFFDDRAGQS